MHICINCDKKFKWDEKKCTWRYQIIGKGYEGYEIAIKFCSKKCLKLIDNKIPYKVNDDMNLSNNIYYNVDKEIYMYK